VSPPGHARRPSRQTGAPVDRVDGDTLSVPTRPPFDRQAMFRCRRVAHALDELLGMHRYRPRSDPREEART